MGWVAGFLLLAGLLAGCNGTPRTPVVIFLDGAGGFGYGGPVRQGLHAAGFRGDFDNHRWSFFVVPADQLLARWKALAAPLADKIKAIREADPEGEIHVVGLSAGTALLLNALEQLPEGIQVDNVALLSSSASAQHDLQPALQHVRGYFYATYSREDYILASLAVNADGEPGPPAGRVGFHRPSNLTRETALLYSRVINLPWKPGYAGYGWNGGHTHVTDQHFIRSVIAPRLLAEKPLPIDRPLVMIER
jgi:pimeloyl-ACP methyl ester carboxylesterase